MASQRHPLVLADATTDLTRFAGHRIPELDLDIVSLTEFRAAGMPGFERYALARATVVLDRLDGDLARILAAKARLDADEPSPPLQQVPGVGAPPAPAGRVGRDLDLMRPR
ncbi:hypothetical protein [Nonomuraea deserti]|uniref:hypothetical protein n=1 Tax=Nonomuraea deserti TaxID=1848322 RepID=UPI001C70AC38|nr:hypothetical protein [Nonomuraea deserti]